MKEEWIKTRHEIHEHLEKIKGLHKMLKTYKTTWSRDTPTFIVPKYHWTKGTSSIISPSLASNNMYELMHKGKITRYDSLNKAKAYVNNNP